MKHVQSLMCSATFAAVLIGAYSQFDSANNNLSTTETKQRTITYHNSSTSSAQLLLADSAQFSGIDIAENNAMHHYYATKTLLQLTSRDNLSLSDKDELKIIGTRETDTNGILYKLQQYYDGIPLSGREIVIVVDHKDEVEILAGKFEANIQLIPKSEIKDQYAYQPLMSSPRDK